MRSRGQQEERSGEGGEEESLRICLECFFCMKIPGGKNRDVSTLGFIGMIKGKAIVMTLWLEPVL